MIDYICYNNYGTPLLFKEYQVETVVEIYGSIGVCPYDLTQ